MGDTDPTMVAALVAAVLALAEVVKALGKLVYSKLTKNGEGAIQKSILELLTRQATQLEEQSRLLRETSEILKEMVSRQAEMYRWHEPEIEPGVKVWWVRKSFEDTVAKLGIDMAKVARSMQDQTRMCNANRESMKEIVRDIESTKDTIHDMAMRQKYRRGVTSSAYPKVKVK